MSKIYLFIDGTNLYAGQYELFGPKQYLDFSRFIKVVEKKLKIKFDKIYFYASYSPRSKRPTKKEKLYLKNEALFYRSVKKTPRLIFFKGYRSKTSGKEKEVDVKLAVDVVNLAYQDKYDVLYLLSGDADFMHAIRIAEGLGKKVFILALQNRIPNRFSYIYHTIIFHLRGKFRNKFYPKQKIETIELEVENLSNRD